MTEFSTGICIPSFGQIPSFRRLSDGQVFCERWYQTPALFDETVRRHVESLEKELATLEREAADLAKEIEELTRVDAPV